MRARRGKAPHQAEGFSRKQSGAPHGGDREEREAHADGGLASRLSRRPYQKDREREADEDTDDRAGARHGAAARPHHPVARTTAGAKRPDRHRERDQADGRSDATTAKERRATPLDHGPRDRGDRQPRKTRLSE
jgi:hypothetical protein